MRRLHPADELAEVRSELARLERRAAELEGALLRGGEAASTGSQHAAEVTETRSRVLDPALLPLHVQNDPALWREVVTQTVTIVPVPSRPQPLRPGWPIRRAAPSSLPLSGIPLH